MRLWHAVASSEHLVHICNSCPVSAAKTVDNQPPKIAILTESHYADIIIHYDTKHEADFHRSLSFYGLQHDVPLPGDEINLMANKIKAEADFLAQRSEFAKTTVDFFSNLDKQLKLTAGNAIDLKLMLAEGLQPILLGKSGHRRNTDVGNPGAVLVEPFRRAAKRTACYGTRSHCRPLIY